MYEERGSGITGTHPVSREEATGRVGEFDRVTVRAAPVPARG
ncbi:hypothetical protein [Streptomyces sp. NPDC127038]